MSPKDKLIQIVDYARSDNLKRCQAAFRGLSQEEMNMEYKNSGQTRQEILDGYIEEQEEWQAAKDLLTELLSR